MVSPFPSQHTTHPPAPPLHRRDERKRSEEALSKVVSEHDAAVKRAAEEAKAEKEAMRRTYDKQLETLREQYETGQVAGCCDLHVRLYPPPGSEV